MPIRDKILYFVDGFAVMLFSGLIAAGVWATFGWIVSH